MPPTLRTYSPPLLLLTVYIWNESINWRCAASPTASACGKATLPSLHLGFSRAGFHAPSLAGLADAQQLEAAGHLLRPRLVAKLPCPTVTSASVGQGFMSHPSRGLANAAHLQRCAASPTTSACGKATLPSPHLGFTRAGFHAPPLAGFGRCIAPLKVRRISYSLGLWQSYVAQPSPRLQSVKVSCAVPRGIGRCPAAFSSIINQPVIPRVSPQTASADESPAVLPLSDAELLTMLA